MTIDEAKEVRDLLESIEYFEEIKTEITVLYEKSDIAALHRKAENMRLALLKVATSKLKAIQIKP